MVFNTEVGESKSSSVFGGSEERQSIERKTSVGKLCREKSEEGVESRNRGGFPCRKRSKSGATTLGLLESNERATSFRADIAEREASLEALGQRKSQSCLESRVGRSGEESQTGKVTPDEEQPPTSVPAVVEVEKKAEGTCMGGGGGKVGNVCSRIGRPRMNVQQKRPSEIPKLKSLQKAGPGMVQRARTFQSRLPVKTTEKELERKPCEDILEGLKSKTETIKTMMKSYGGGGKKETKSNEKIKEAMGQDFGYLVPLYEREFKRISDVWVNTIYCSLTMRTNLVKLLFQAFPNINRTHFHTEDDRLLHCIANAKNCTRLEAENLIKFVKTMVANREKTKEDYEAVIANKEIADSYNHDWRKLLRKVAVLGEEAKHLQLETPELQKKKEASETNTNEKIRRMEINLCKKEDDIKKLMDQLNLLKQKESSYKDGVLLKIPDYKEIRADIQTLMAIQKEFDELKTKYMFQNYAYEKKIKDLENLVEEKKKVLEKEREVKKQLQVLLGQLQAHQKRLAATVGKEQVDYIMGRQFQDGGKRREQLWVAAVNLVLRGFLIQMKKLERDRNKMLLELQANDLEGFANTVALIQKDNFIRSIKQQMNDLQKIKPS